MILDTIRQNAFLRRTDMTKHTFKPTAVSNKVEEIKSVPTMTTADAEPCADFNTQRQRW